MEHGRRKFLNWILGDGLAGLFGSIVYPMFAYLDPPRIAEANVNSVKVGPVDGFPPQYQPDYQVWPQAGDRHPRGGMGCRRGDPVPFQTINLLFC